MERSLQGSNKLITGIENDARMEADRIIAEAQKSAQQRREAGKQQAEVILKEAREKAQEQIKATERNMEQAAAIETRRTSLKLRGQIIHKILQEVGKDLERLIDKPAYRQLVLEWIVEAAIGLNVKEASVNSSAGERPILDDHLLAEAEAKVKELTGRTISLTRSSDDPLLAQGVVLTAKDGRLAFNNQVPTRLLRYQSEIRKLIIDELFERGLK